MSASKQAELINELMSMLNEDEKLLCEPVISYLTDLQYTAKQRKKSTFTIEFEKHGRVIVKLEYGKAAKADLLPHLIFWMRFSACDRYTKIFQDAVNQRPEAWIKRGEHWKPQEGGCCGTCRGKPRFYHYTNEEGTSFDNCGGFTKRVPGVTHEDVPDILRMIKVQDEHFIEMLA